MVYSDDKSKAAIKIQRFWRKRQAQVALAGKNNYDFYLSLLNPYNSDDPYIQLAKMMYGRVIATPEGEFPFLKQKNPYLGFDSSYHRNDIHGSALTSIILEQWGLEEEADYLYIPVLNAQLGTINSALKALNWTSDNYELIETPLKLAQANQIKIIKLKKISEQDNFFTEKNRWGQLSSLGIIASPWLVSKIAVECGYRSELEDKEPHLQTSNLSQHSLERQPKTIDELKKSDVFKKLKLLKDNSDSESSLLAKALHSIIHTLPSNIIAPDIIARLSFFIETALLMQQDDHTLLGNWVSIIIHEVSLLLIKYNASQPVPLINNEDYQSQTAAEINPWLNLHNPDYQFIALPAHSGTHANFIASQLAQDLSQTKDPKPKNIQRMGGEYWEVMNKSREYTLFGPLVETVHTEIVRLSVGPVGDYQAGTYPAIDINKLIRHEAQNNNKLKTLVIDTTSASYEHLKLEPDVVQIMSEKNISLIFWESCQKFGLLHTDQAQYGRVFAYCHRNSILPSQFESLKQKSESDLHMPDAQIGAFISKTSQDIISLIREKHFRNGLILRQILSGDHYKGINKNKSYELRVDNQKDPFLFLSNDFTQQEIQRIQKFFNKMELNRSSFGHRYNTQEGGKRISAGAENPTDEAIFALGLKYYMTTTSSEKIYKKITDLSRNLDLSNKDDLINYLSLIKAWQVFADLSQPINRVIAYQLRTIITQSSHLRKNILKASPQFLTDIYALLKTNSPFKQMIKDAKLLHNPFAIKLFEIMNETYKKTGKIELTNSIKKTIRTLEHIPFEQQVDEAIIIEHTHKLLSGAYSSSASNFFNLQKGQENNEHQFRTILNIIEKKYKLFTTNKHHDAAKAALKLYKALEQASVCYFKKHPTPESYSEFKTTCLNATKEARKVLQHHRGWTHFLSILVLSIMSCGIIPSILAIDSKINRKTWGFRLFETKSSKELDSIEEQIKQMNNPGA